MSNMFPDFFEKLREIEDYRRLSEYELAELIMAAIAMFLFKEGSRNAFNNDRKDKRFRENYKKLFKMNLPHMDTVDDALKVLTEEVFENLKDIMIKHLFKRKIFRKQRFQDYYIIAVDATGFQSYIEGKPFHLHKTSRNGKKSYFVNVLEAKLVTFNGISISIETEWIDNIQQEYDKQNCESKAFKNIAARIKEKYSRLKICIAADGLYPNKTFFDICKKNEWKFIVTFKDGNLKTLWKEIECLKLNNKSNLCNIFTKNSLNYIQDYCWFNNLEYKEHHLNYLECIETKVDSNNKTTINRFVHLTNFSISKKNIIDTSLAGRLRWKIENEGFNIQKNHGYRMQHKYSRASYTATKNYYQCMQIAHIINQLTELNSTVKELLTGGMTIKHLWKKLHAFMSEGNIIELEINLILKTRTLFKFE